jgi:hypothetical protein
MKLNNSQLKYGLLKDIMEGARIITPTQKTYMDLFLPFYYFH